MLLASVRHLHGAPGLRTRESPSLRNGGSVSPPPARPLSITASGRPYARIFDSVLRGEDAEDSDLDPLVEPQPGATLLQQLPGILKSGS